MVEYIPIDDSEVEPEAPLVSSLGVRWRDNPLAIAEGADGAPRIQTDAYEAGSVDQAAIGASAVGQSELKTTVGSVNLGMPSGGTGQDRATTIPGGEYAFAVNTRITNDEDSPGGSFFVGDTTRRARDYALRGTIIRTDDFQSVDGDFRARYIQSSPPYDHGDGDVRGYVYASINSDNKVDGLYLAEDPPWYGNTQHTPIAQWRDKETGKEYQRTRKLKCCKKDVDEGRISMAEFIERAGECEDVVEEITPEVKLRGMDELPHPFEEREGRTIVLLDPMDEKISRLIRMMQAGEYVHELFREGYLIVDNEPCKRCGPPGVPIHGVKWRKT